MAGYFSPEEIDRVRQATDIVRLISEYLPLKRTGRSYTALCPFHQEKTPSFNVNAERQIYKCFGCGEGGNVFGFIMRREGMTFPEAVRMLADRAGIKLQARPQERKQGELKEKLFEVHAWAAEFFQRKLFTSSGEAARSYLARRQLAPEIVSRFKLGWSADAWDDLLQTASSKGYSPALLERCGLVIPRERGEGYYDRFRGRLMFPIFDVRGRVLGFGGRTLKKEESAKYLNSPATALFDKSRCLYGLNFARSALSRRQQVVVVEGYTDCLMAHQLGIDWVVATLGTALTMPHLQQLRGYCEEVILVFDADAAGAQAAERSLELFLRAELEPRLVVLEEGLDPCDFLVERGSEAFLSELEGAVSLFRRLLERSREKLEAGTAAERARAVDDLLGQVLVCPDLVKCDRMLRDMAEHLGVGCESLRGRIARLRKRGSAPSVEEEREEGIDAQREAVLLRVLLVRADLVEKVMTEVPLEAFEHPDYRAIAQRIYSQYWESGRLDLQQLISSLTESGLDSTLVGLSQDRPADFDFDNLLEGCLAAFRKRDEARTLQAIRSKLKGARLSGDERSVNHWLQELETLKKQAGAPA